MDAVCKRRKSMASRILRNSPSQSLSVILMRKTRKVQLMKKLVEQKKAEALADGKGRLIRKKQREQLLHRWQLIQREWILQ